MKHLSIVAALALACACSKSKDTPAAGSGTAAGGSAEGSAIAGSAGSGSAAVAADAMPPPPPYTPAADVPKPIVDAIAADRPDKDRQLDAGRKPAEVLAFFKIAPGQKIGELFSGPGATTELLARIAGKDGKVYAQNTKEMMDQFARAPLTERVARPGLENVTILERPLDDPFGPDVKDLDAVVFFLNYHDAVGMKVDRAKMNKAVFAALKKGGIYAITDHSAAKGKGIADADTLHRIEEELVKQEVLAAGFKLDAESDLLRVADDARDWNSSPRAAGARRGHSDRFVLRFVKP